MPRNMIKIWLFDQAPPVLFWNESGKVPGGPDGGGGGGGPGGGGGGGGAGDPLPYASNS